MKYLSESQAWDKIARAFYKPREERNSQEVRLTTCGVCFGATILYELELIHRSLMNHIKTTAFDDAELFGGCSIFGRYQLRHNDIFRADYCALQSIIAEGEAK